MMTLDPSASFSRAYDHLPEPWNDLISITRMMSPCQMRDAWIEGDGEQRRHVDNLLHHQRDLLHEIERECPAREPRAARWLGDDAHNPV